MSHDSTHLTYTQLNDLIGGRLSEADSAAANAHLEECAECLRRFDATLKDRADPHLGTSSVLPPELPEGTVIGGRFKIVGPAISQGGQAATVYKASHNDSQGEVRTVAVKVFALRTWAPDEHYDFSEPKSWPTPTSPTRTSCRFTISASIPGRRRARTGRGTGILCHGIAVGEDLGARAATAPPRQSR